MLPLFQPLAGLLAAGHQLYAVGGAVRAHLRGQGGAEADFATPSLPEEILKTAASLGLPTKAEGLRWGSVQVAGCDITTFRTECYIPGNRYPSVAFTNRLEEDAIRRDFTCNAVYLAPDGTLTDPFGGLTDWQQGQVVWINHPKERLAEDPLRWWRWLRFCAETVQEIESEIFWYDVTTKHRQTLPLAEVARGAAQGLAWVNSTRLAKERAKFAAKPNAASVRRAIATLLAKNPTLSQELLP